MRDAREHGVQALPVDVRLSHWDSVLEAPASPAQTQGAGSLRAVRLGFNRISGLAQAAVERVLAARALAPFAGPEDLVRRAALDARALALLADADALQHLPAGVGVDADVGTTVGHRHQAAWAVAGIDTRATPLLRATRTHEAPALLPPPSAADSTLADYRATGLTLQQHPLALLRAQLNAFRVQPAAVLKTYPNGRLARASGIVTHRQRPETAKGVVFVTLEDDTGSVNVIVWPKVAALQRRVLLGATLLTVYGVWQRSGGSASGSASESASASDGQTHHLIASTLVDHSALLHGLATKSRNFR